MCVIRHSQEKGMLSKLKRFLVFGSLRRKPEPLAVDDLEDDLDLDWLDPPADPLDSSAWDSYWTEHLRHEIGPPFFDMFCDDRRLVEVMNSEGMKSVLCAGSGISQEPHALADAGFEVMALDLSPRAMAFVRDLKLSSEGFDHFCAPDMRRPGGRVDFITGNILDSTVCPGPFDVIIERLTAQNYINGDIGAVLGGLAKRLSPGGIFLSHTHDGSWRPPADPRHFTKAWFQDNQWTIWDGNRDRKPRGRVAWPITSTG
jgi:SAM-dependent methyltransferase